MPMHTFEVQAAVDAAKQMTLGNVAMMLSAKLKEDLYAAIPSTVFFFVALHIVAFIRLLMVKQATFQATSTIASTIAALVLRKTVLVADMLPFINRFPEKPLIYNVAWKTAIYLLVAAVVHYLERLVDFSRQAGGVIAGNQKLLAEMVGPHFWVIQILLFVLILMYCTMRELLRVIGRDKIKRMFFGPMPAPEI